jgi:hypothetical protein
MQIFDHNIGFREKRQFFRQKLAKIAENCDHNIGPLNNVMISEVSMTKKSAISAQGKAIYAEKYHNIGFQ